MPTITTIAKALNLSPMTVSRALNGSFENARASTRAKAEKIREAATKMGYRTNVAARIMRSGRVDDIALILSTQTSLSILPESLLEGIFKALYQSGHHLIMAPVKDKDLTNPGYVPNILAEWRAGGVLINYNAKIPPRMIELMKRFDPPHIWLNSKHAANCVHIDDHAAAEQLTSHLLAAGLKKIAYADYYATKGEPPWHYSGVDRYNGYAAQMAAAGLVPCRVDSEIGPANTPVSPADAAAFTVSWLLSKQRPDAVVCYNPQTARTLHYAIAATRHKLSGPPPVVAVFCDRETWEFADASVTQLIPFVEMAFRGAKLLLEQMAFPPGSKAPKSAPVKLRPGKTLAGRNVVFKRGAKPLIH